MHLHCKGRVLPARGSTLLAMAYIFVWIMTTYLMITESPDRIRATRSWSSAVSR